MILFEKPVGWLDPGPGDGYVAIAKATAASGLAEPDTSVAVSGVTISGSRQAIAQLGALLHGGEPDG
jgi:hypothetical protein